MRYYPNTMPTPVARAIFAMQLQDFLTVHTGIGHGKTFYDACSYRRTFPEKYHAQITYEICVPTTPDIVKIGPKTEQKLTKYGIPKKSGRWQRAAITAPGALPHIASASVSAVAVGPPPLSLQYAQQVAVGERKVSDDGLVHIEYGNGEDACEYRSLKDLYDVDWTDVPKIENICTECMFQIGQTFLPGAEEDISAYTQEQIDRYNEEERKKYEAAYINAPDEAMGDALIGLTDTLIDAQDGSISVPIHRRDTPSHTVRKTKKKERTA